jgi:alkylhydroperoxidase family enzyme/thiol-disulfide isomerase/thioredoxin
MPRDHRVKRSLAALLAVAVLTAIPGICRAQAVDPPAKPKVELPGKPNISEEDALRAAKFLTESFDGQPATEAAEMLIAIARGSMLGPGEGWFHPAQTRYSWKWLAEKYGIKPDGVIPKAQFTGPEALFARLDRNKDGVLRADDFDWSDKSQYASQSGLAGAWFRRINKSADGRITREEWLKFFDEAAGGKDHLTPENLREALMGGPPPKMSPGNAPTPQVLVRGLFRGEIGSMNEGPKLNDPAPDFSLKTRDGKDSIRLSDHFGKKPIVIVCGNFTCGPFRTVYPRVEEIAQRYKDQALFLGIYVREAHPTDGWRMSSNDDAGVTFPQPHDYGERTEMANRCSGKLKMSIPLLVDEMDDRVGHAYSGMPSRLYVIDRAGKVAYKSGRGPFGFKPEEMEQSLVMCLLEHETKPEKVKPDNGKTKPAASLVPLLKDEEAWKRLPPVEKGADQPLPSWALALADTLPRTTSRMLELDYLQREKSPLDPKLRAKMRWVAAHANRCDYGESYALADLRRAGADDATIKALTGDRAKWPADERAALVFARKLTLTADQVTDDEVTDLLKAYGEKKVVAMVLMLAYANFQDRLVTTLGLTVEEGGPLLPPDVRFTRSTEAPKAVARKAAEGTSQAPAKPFSDDWTKLDFKDLQEKMTQQRDRPARIAVPTWEQVLAGLPKDFPVSRPSRIKWSLVCFGYQPELTAGWLMTMRTFGEESKQDRVFEESLFWVVTRSLNCFY